MIRHNIRVMDELRYSYSARIIHWLMALGFIMMWITGLTMDGSSENTGAINMILTGTHIATGVSLIILLLARILIRLIHQPPQLPESLAEWEKTASRIGHIALYVLPIFVMAAGWLTVEAGGKSVVWLGVEMPNLLALAGIGTLGESTEEFLSEIHELGAFLFMFVAVVHVVAVIKHKWIDGHDVLDRMSLRLNKRSGSATR